VGILGTGAYLPERVLTNHDLEKMVDTNDEWITQRTGIRERRMCEADACASDLAAPAAEMALENAGVSAKDIDLIICATTTPDAFLPSTACFLQARIGAENAGAFDLSAACTGFVYALTAAHGHIVSGVADRVLVVGTECLTKITDFTDRTSCILFGDGAGAVVLGTSDSGGILRAILGADGTQAEMMIIPAGGSRQPATHESVDDRQHYMKIRGREVYKFAVNKMAEMVAKVVAKSGLTLDDVDLVVPHQVNIRIIESAAKRLNMSMDKVYVNIDRYGNTSAASVPIALHEAVMEGRIKKDDLVVLVGFGGGLTWAATALRW